jgi:hypothetical protein
MTTDLLESVDELATLKHRADMLRITYHPSIGVEKLREKVNAVVNSKPADLDLIEGDMETPPVPGAVVETEGQYRNRMQKDASRLIRVRLTCMNPNKTDWNGEIFTIANTVAGVFRKFVPFNADGGWHVPHIIYEHIQQRECQIFTTEKDGKGNSVRRGKLIKEFSVEVMPQLTQDELNELARRQAMSKSIE